jgi:hypothetical protein
MKWIKKLLGIESNEEKLKRKAKVAEEKAFKATRKGDLELAGKFKKEAEDLYEQLYNINIGDQNEK